MISLRQRIARVEHICHLCVLVKTFSRRRGHDKFPVVIRMNDIANLHKLLGACQRTPSELYYLLLISHKSFPVI